jgi:hypothetical protein
MRRRRSEWPERPGHRRSALHARRAPRALWRVDLRAAGGPIRRRGLGRCRSDAPSPCADQVLPVERRASGIYREQIADSWHIALDSADRAMHAAHQINVFSAQEVMVLERRLRAERHWLNQCADLESIWRSPRKPISRNPEAGSVAPPMAHAGSNARLGTTKRPTRGG